MSEVKMVPELKRESTTELERIYERLYRSEDFESTKIEYALLPDNKIWKNSVSKKITLVKLDTGYDEEGKTAGGESSEIVDEAVYRSKKYRDFGKGRDIEDSSEDYFTPSLLLESYTFVDPDRKQWEKVEGGVGFQIEGVNGVFFPIMTKSNIGSLGRQTPPSFDGWGVVWGFKPERTILDGGEIENVVENPYIDPKDLSKGFDFRSADEKEGKRMEYYGIIDSIVAEGFKINFGYKGRDESWNPFCDVVTFERSK